MPSAPPRGNSSRGRGSPSPAPPARSATIRRARLNHLDDDHPSGVECAHGLEEGRCDGSAHSLGVCPQSATAPAVRCRGAVAQRHAERAPGRRRRRSSAGRFPGSAAARLRDARARALVGPGGSSTGSLGRARPLSPAEGKSSGEAPASSTARASSVSVKCLRPPTSPARPPLRGRFRLRGGDGGGLSSAVSVDGGGAGGGVGCAGSCAGSLRRVASSAASCRWNTISGAAAGASPSAGSPGPRGRRAGCPAPSLAGEAAGGAASGLSDASGMASSASAASRRAAGTAVFARTPEPRRVVPERASAGRRLWLRRSPRRACAVGRFLFQPRVFPLRKGPGRLPHGCRRVVEGASIRGDRRHWSRLRPKGSARRPRRPCSAAGAGRFHGNEGQRGRLLVRLARPGLEDRRHAGAPMEKDREPRPRTVEATPGRLRRTGPSARQLPAWEGARPLLGGRRRVQGARGRDPIESREWVGTPFRQSFLAFTGRVIAAAGPGHRRRTEVRLPPRGRGGCCRLCLGPKHGGRGRTCVDALEGACMGVEDLYLAGHRGMVGSAILRAFEARREAASILRDPHPHPRSSSTSPTRRRHARSSRARGRTR